MKSGFRSRNFFIFLFCIVFGILVLLFFHKKQQENFLVVSFLNIGQGDAIFIEAPNGKQVLVDAGPNESVVYELGKVMSFWDRNIDMIIPTHADADHIGGFPEILERFSVDIIYDSQSSSTTGIYEAYEKQVQEEKSIIQKATSNDTIILDEKHGVYIRVLFPDGDVSELERNDASTVLQLVYGDIEFMLTGDAGTMVEEYLVYQYGNNLLSEVLKAGHHGSRTSTSENFLEVVDPEYVVISAGENNRYGHPHQEVVDLIVSSGAKMLETKYGTIQFFTDGQKLVVK
jgi:competence protein ComEC